MRSVETFHDAGVPPLHWVEIGRREGRAGNLLPPGATQVQSNLRAGIDPCSDGTQCAVDPVGRDLRIPSILYLHLKLQSIKQIHIADYHPLLHQAFAIVAEKSKMTLVPPVLHQAFVTLSYHAARAAGAVARSTSVDSCTSNPCRQAQSAPTPPDKAECGARGRAIR